MMQLPRAAADTPMAITGFRGAKMKILHIAESAQGGVGTYLTEILADQARRYGRDRVRALVPAQHAAHLSGVDRRLLVTWRRRARSLGGVL